jgi:hypothetical protein
MFATVFTKARRWTSLESDVSSPHPLSNAMRDLEKLTVARLVKKFVDVYGTSSVLRSRKLGTGP